MEVPIELPDRLHVLETMVLVKAIDMETGETFFLNRCTDGLTMPEALGMLELYGDDLRMLWRVTQEDACGG